MPPSKKLETLSYDRQGNVLNVIAKLRRLGFDIGWKVCKKGKCESWTILAAVDCSNSPHLVVAYDGSTATLDMAIYSYAKSPLRQKRIGARIPIQIVRPRKAKQPPKTP